MSKHPGMLFITGMYRSGTTLLDKLLHMHPQVCVASQPFPLLMFQGKTAFYEQRGLSYRYPLDHLFKESRYSRAEWYDFLQQCWLSEEDIDNLFAALADYPKGHWTPEILQHRFGVHGDVFPSVFRQMMLLGKQVFSKDGTEWVGSKEIVCEEYVPYLLGQGYRVIIVIRDPRDVIASLNNGDHERYTGNIRPTLFNIRNWRKSVAFAFACAGYPNFQCIKYERLVEDPFGTLNNVARWLGITPYSANLFAEGLHDQRGQRWHGNSSFQPTTGVEARASGRYMERLPVSVIRYIEACCWPEMKAMGYPTVSIEGFEESVLHEYREPFEVTHAMFPSNYSSKTDHVSEEIDRFRGLIDGQGEFSANKLREWYIDESAYAKLREAVRH